MGYLTVFALLDHGQVDDRLMVDVLSYPMSSSAIICDIIAVFPRLGVPRSIMDLYISLNIM